MGYAEAWPTIRPRPQAPANCGGTKACCDFVIFRLPTNERRGSTSTAIFTAGMDEAIEDYKKGNMQERERTRKKIAFFGHFGSSNFGNESALQAILYHLRCFCPDAEVTCICTGPEATVATHQIEAIPVTEVAYCVVPGPPKCGILPLVRPAMGLQGRTLWRGRDRSPNFSRRLPTRRAARPCSNVAGRMDSFVPLAATPARPR